MKKKREFSDSEYGIEIDVQMQQQQQSTNKKLKNIITKFMPMTASGSKT